MAVTFFKTSSGTSTLPLNAVFLRSAIDQIILSGSL
jgi:hypothetical protein